MRHHALTNKDPTVIVASVALAWLMDYANRNLGRIIEIQTVLHF